MTLITQSMIRKEQSLNPGLGGVQAYNRIRQRQQLIKGLKTLGRTFPTKRY